MSATPIPLRLIQKNGILYFFDKSRSKWLSVFREFIFFNINHNNLQTSQWMLQNGIRSNIQGYLISKNSTIVSISFLSNNESDLKIKIYNDNLNILNIPVINENKKIIENLNIDIDKNRIIKALLEIKNDIINFPTLKLELCWRKD